MIRGIGHLAFDVADMNKSIDFYCGILGFKKAFSIEDDHGNPWIEYIKVREGQFIELFYGAENNPKR
nr:VOC family protein [Paenibacillus sp. AR247]